MTPDYSPSHVRRQQFPPTIIARGYEGMAPRLSNPQPPHPLNLPPFQEKIDPKSHQKM